MKKLVIIGAGTFQVPLIKRAKELHFETHVFAWRDGSEGETIADYFYPISIVEKDNILDVCRTIHPDAVTTIASDLANITASYVAENLGLPCLCDSVIVNTTNKYHMRKALSKAGILCPAYEVITLSDWESKLSNFSLPFILKPTDRSGSRSVTKIMTKSEILPALKRAVADSFEQKAIAEGYIDGVEYSIETISYAGVHSLLSITRKYTTGAPHFIETGHIEPAPVSDKLKDTIQTLVFQSLDALGIQTGAAHSELKITESGIPVIIEIGARMGGDCIGSHLVPLTTGYDYLRMVIDTAMGITPDFTPLNHHKHAFIRFIMNQNDYLQFTALKESFPDCIVHVSKLPEDYSVTAIDSSTRPGYYICAFDDEQIYEKLCMEILGS
ncbi:MAG: ATP-grasp domain-containing protein [Lachnospiraceae bacterium]|nr:ATP-grasp domain-containing protein [Lachnospiraceae bacterium]MDD3614845.1 ATP-grasp domain-containing protein [Lachnospiraceae bacterium]